MRTGTLESRSSTVRAVRAVLVVNPNATTTNPRRAEVVVSALRAHLDLTVCHTLARGHARELTAQAKRDSVELVICLSGDGTINEVVNGIVEDAPTADQPILGIIPGGHTNVFARALGLPRDAVEATGTLLKALQANQRRSVSLGRLDDRWFTFCAGMGFDAEVVRRVENKRREGHRASAALYARMVAAEYAERARQLTGRLTLTESDGTQHELATLVTQNTTPWTYIGNRAIAGSLTASFDRGLDVVGITTLKPGPLLRTIVRFLGNRMTESADMVTIRDTNSFTVTASAPMAVHVDGDYVGEHDQLSFSSAANALTVLAPNPHGAEFFRPTELH